MDYDSYSIRTLRGLPSECYHFYESERAFRFHFASREFQGRIVLDFGGRVGEKTLRIKNIEVIDIDPEARKLMAKNGIRCKDSLSHYANGTVDTIYCSHVLEHLDEPGKYLQTMLSKLKDDGRLILVLPTEAQDFDPKIMKINGNGHLQAWNFSLVFSTLDMNGFQALEWRLVYDPLNFLFTFNILGRTGYRIPRLVLLFYLDSLSIFSRYRCFRFCLFSMKRALEWATSVIYLVAPKLEGRASLHSAIHEEMLIVARKKTAA